MLQTLKDGYPLAGQLWVVSTLRHTLCQSSSFPHHPLLHYALYSWDWECANSIFQPPLLGGFLFGSASKRFWGVIRRLGKKNQHSAAGSGCVADAAGGWQVLQWWQNSEVSTVDSTCSALCAGLGAHLGQVQKQLAATVSPMVQQPLQIPAPGITASDLRLSCHFPFFFPGPSKSSSFCSSNPSKTFLTSFLYWIPFEIQNKFWIVVWVFFNEP